MALDQFRDALRRGRSDFRIVVPTATLEHHLRNRLAREGLVFRPEFITTLSRFTAPFVTDLPQVPDAWFYLMVEDAVRRTRRDEFAKVAEMPGFHASLARTLRDLDTAGCDAEMLSVRVAGAPLGEALVAVWQEVEAETVRRRVATRAGRLQLAAARITRDGLAGVRNIAMEGFATFSDPELLLVKALSEHAEVRVAQPSGARVRSRLLIADSIEREADEVARRILVESESGVPFREMGIVVRNPDVYEPVLRATLERFGIPARFYFETALHEHPVTRFIAGLMDARLAGWEHEQTLAALRLAPKTGVSAAMDRLDIAIRELLPSCGIEKLLELAASDESLLKLIETCGASSQPGTEPRALFRPGKLPDEIPWSAAAIYRSQAAARTAIEGAIEQAVAWHGGAVPFPVLWPTVKTILRLTPLRVPDQRRNVVHVLSAYEARQWDLSTVFVCGLIEGQFPKHHPQNTFLPDAAIRKLQGDGIRLRTSEDRDAEEAFLFGSAADRATRSLLLSYPRADGRGEPNVPSTFLDGSEVEEPCVRTRPEPLPAPAKWKPASAIQHPDLLRVLTTSHASLNATALESYLQCPFQFFASKTLRLREFPPRPEDRLDFLTMGTIVHKVLAEWFVERPPLEPLFDRVFLETCEGKRIPLGYRAEMLRYRMLQDLRRFCSEDKWPRGAAVETEIDFNFRLDDSVSIKGRIDRLERGPDGSAMVVDYKYSKANNARKLIEDATKLQAPLYLLAIERAFELTPAAMVYYSLRDELRIFGRGTVPGLEAPLIPLDRGWLDAAEERVAESVRELRAGRIVPAPASLEPCRYCDFRDVCRYEAGAAIAASGA